MKRDEMGLSRPSNPSGYERPIDRNPPPRENPYRPADQYERQDYERPSPSSYQRPMAPPRPSSPGTGMSSPARAMPPRPSSSPSRPLPSRTTSPGMAARPLSSSRPSSNYNSSSMNYSGPNTSKPPSKFAEYFLKGLWIFSIFLLARLVFTERGVMEYYGRKGNLKEKFDQLSSIKKENKDLEREIKKIRKNTSYQKSLVRNHLGFIAKDEFIVLLPD